MTKEKGSSDPSMEEILSSIRQLIADDSKATPSSAVFEDNEDILDLTDLLPNEEVSSEKTKAKKPVAGEKKNMRLPAWAENIKSPFPTGPRRDEESGGRDEVFLSRLAAAETAQALKNLTQLVHQKQPLEGSSLKDSREMQAVELQLREILKPLLKEWLDTNLPVLVRWIVNEQIEKLIRQYGLMPVEAKK